MENGGAEPKPNVAGILLEIAAEVIFFPFHLFLQRPTARREVAAAFESLLPLPEIFGSAPLPCTPHTHRPPLPPAHVTVQIRVWNHRQSAAGARLPSRLTPCAASH